MTPHLPDRRSGLVLDTHELNRRAGVLREVTRVAEAPADLGIDVIGVPPGSPVDFDLRLESVVEGVLVTGTAQVRLRGNCARCLDEINDTVEVDLQELFCYPGKELDDAEARHIEGELIDLEPVLRDAVVLDLPFMPLCRPDCAGLCPECGASLNADPDHNHAEPIDPRWAGLVGLTEPKNEPKNKE
ncbi:MAG: YceD family protein [Propionicimonas sp.]